MGSLRVLGSTRAEIVYVLLGELWVLIITGIPLGFFIGRAMAAYTLLRLESDLFRIPLIIEPGSYAFAATIVLISALQQVKIGHRRGLRVEVLSGLNEGDEVIVHPDEAIEDGTRVRLR